MLGLDSTYKLLFRCLDSPRTMVEVSLAEWDRLIPLARSVGLFSRLAALAFDSVPDADLPPEVKNPMRAVSRYVAHRQQRILWEVRQLEQVLGKCGVRVLLLKGTAYLVGGLQVAKGRIFGDVDILVLKEDVALIENQLREAGWVSDDLSPHDERYYREWMHELPALRHPIRLVEVDVHHSISPLTSRLKVDVRPFFDNARAVDGHRFLVPAAWDLLLHSAVHLFFGGEFENGLRDLSDMDLILREAQENDPDFLEQLRGRAVELGLELPLFYALRYTRQFYGTPVPESFVDDCSGFGPHRIALFCMDRLLPTALMADGAAPPKGRVARARFWLWLRAHLIKMPLGLLVYHALKKTTMGKVKS